MDLGPAASAVQNTWRPKVGTRQLLVLSAVVCVALLVLILFFQPSVFKKKLSFGHESLTFSSTFEKARFGELLELSAQSKEPGDEAKYLVLAFQTLNNDYFLKPTEEKREVLLKMHAHLSQNFPKETTGNFLTVPCRQESCGVTQVWSDDLNKIKETVEKLNLADEYKKTILLNLESAAIAQAKEDKGGKFNALASVFASIKSISSQGEAKQMEEAMQLVLDLMKEIDGQKFAIGEKLGVYKIR